MIKFDYLGPIIFDMVVHLFKRLNGLEGRQEGQRLGRRAPVGVRPSGVDDDVKLMPNFSIITTMTIPKS